MIMGILGAMREEVDLIRSDLMCNITETTIGGRTYYQGFIHEVPVVLVFSRWGKVASSISTTTLINTFGVNQVIFTGVAGALSSQLNIGDVVISNRLYQHDMNATPLFPQHEIPLTGQTFYESDSSLVMQSKKACEYLIESFFDIFTNTHMLHSFGITAPTCCVGLIASGDQFINSSEKIAQLISDQPETLAVEMEGASVAQVCHEHNIPCVIIRIISDKADSCSAIDFPQFVASIASQYSKYIINHLVFTKKMWPWFSYGRGSLVQ